MSGLRTTTTDHYRFRYRAGSLAEREIDHIARTQEICLEHICAVLGVAEPPSITYVLCDSPEDVAEQSGEDEPTAAVACYPSSVFAEYSERNRCIGPHEDAHIVANIIGRPSHAFIRESIAMYFDATWRGIPNRAWVQHFLNTGHGWTTSDLIRSFDQLDCNVTYPIAGFWAEVLIHRFGAAALVDFYGACGDDPWTAFAATFGVTLAEFDEYVRRCSGTVQFGPAIVDAVRERAADLGPELAQTWRRVASVE